jgi:hypothetical protein
MNRDGRIVSRNEQIDFIDRYRPDFVTHVCRYINHFLLARPDPLVLNFGPCTEAFPGCVLRFSHCPQGGWEQSPGCPPWPSRRKDS